MARRNSRIASAIAGIFVLNTVFAAAGAGETVSTGTLSLPPDLISLPCWPDNVEGLKVRAKDAAGQEARSSLLAMSLPKRVFKNPAAQVLEQQRCLLAADTGKKEDVAQAVGTLLSGHADSVTSAPAWLALQSLHRTLTDAETDEDLYKFIALSWDVMLLLEEPPAPEKERPLRGAWNERAGTAGAAQTSMNSLKNMEEFLAQQEKLLDQASAGQMSEQARRETAKMLEEQRAMLDALKNMSADLEKANPDLARKAMQNTLDRMQEQMRRQMQKAEGNKDGQEHDGEQNAPQNESGNSGNSSNQSQRNGMQGQMQQMQQMQQMRDAQKMQKQYEEIQKILAEQQKLLDETTGQKPLPDQEQIRSTLQEMKDDIAREREKQQARQESAQQMRAQAERLREDMKAQDTPAPASAENTPEKLEADAQKQEKESRKNLEKLDKMESALQDMEKQEKMNEQQKKEMLQKLEEIVQAMQDMNRQKDENAPHKDKKEEPPQETGEEEPDNPLTTQELEKLLGKIKSVVQDLATFFTEQQKTLGSLSRENIKNLEKTSEWIGTTQDEQELRTILNTLRTFIDMDPMPGTELLRDQLEQIEDMLNAQDESAFLQNGKPFIMLASADPALEHMIIAQALTTNQTAIKEGVRNGLEDVASALRQKNRDRLKRAEKGQELVDHMKHYIKDLDDQIDNARKDGSNPDRETLESMTKEARKIIDVLQKLSEQQMEDHTKKKKEGNSAPPPDIEMRQEAEEKVDQLMRQLEQMQKPQNDGPALQMKMDKKNLVPTKLGEEQENLRTRLNQLQEGMDQGMLPLDQAGEAMDEASRQLRENNREEAASRQKQAIQSLEQAAGELKARLQQSLQGMSMPGSKSGKGSGGPKDREQSDIEQGLTDPLGRPSAYTPAGKSAVPEDGSSGRAREIEQTVRDRLKNPQTREKERRYLERIIKRYEP